MPIGTPVLTYLRDGAVEFRNSVSRVLLGAISADGITLDGEDVGGGSPDAGGSILHQATVTLTLRGLVSSRLGRVTVSTPFSYAAVILSACTT